MFHHFYDSGVHTKGQGAISRDEFYKLINFIGKKNRKSNLISEKDYNKIVNPKKMIKPN